MARIEKKCWPEFFQAIVDGTKAFEIRLADVKYEPGDILVLREWDPLTEQHTGREIEKEITYVIETRELKFWPKEETEKHGLVVLSLK